MISAKEAKLETLRNLDRIKNNRRLELEEKISEYIENAISFGNSNITLTLSNKDWALHGDYLSDLLKRLGYNFTYKVSIDAFSISW